MLLAEGKRFMAKQATATAETGQTPVESNDGPLLDTLNSEVKKMIAKGKERGYVTYDELNAALPQDQVSSEQIEDTMSMLSESGINVVENEEGEDTAGESDSSSEKEPEAAASGNVNEDIGRSDDPVRMYLREMGSVELLSRGGEIAIAKRIEVGRDMMISGIYESPMTVRAILQWREALDEGLMLLRDIIDLDATFSGPRPDESALGGNGAAIGGAPMPRDNICLSCSGAFDDDDMADEVTCVFCENGVDSGSDEGF